MKKLLRTYGSYALGVLPFLSVPSRRFVIFGQGRTGSTLLTTLLNNHPEIHCDREIFNIYHFTGRRVTRPILYINGRSKRYRNYVYGFKIKPYQLEEDHQLGEAGAQKVLDFLNQSDVRFIYLHRENLLRHAISNVLLERTGVTHMMVADSSKSKKTSSRFDSIEIEPAKLLANIRFRESYLVKEARYLAGIQFLEVVYERDLENSESHLATVNRVLDFLTLSEIEKVTTRLRRINRHSLQDILTNYEEIASYLDENGYGHFLT